MGVKVHMLSGVSRNEGGLFYSVRWLSRALLMSGVEIRLISHIDRFTAEDLPLWHPVDVRVYRSFGPLKSSLKLRRILKQSEPDLLHVHGLWLDRQWAALQWQIRADRPVILSPRGMLDPWALRNSAWKKRLVGQLFANSSLQRATCIHALCRSEEQSIRAYGLKGPVAIIPNGVELPESRCGEEDDRGRSSGRQLLFMGRIHPKKGVAELLKAWGSRGGAWRNDWVLVLAGWDDGGHEPALRKLADDLGISDSVTFAGPKFGQEKEALLRSADAFILPSFSEGLPMSVLEAWSYGLPVLMTDFCNLPEGFAANAALRIDPDEASIARGLSALAGMSRDDIGSMGRNGRLLVEDKFTWDRIAQDMKAVYEWCLGGDKPACIER